MEEINVITNLIGNIGFPIAMCVIMLKMWRDSINKHEEETKGFVEAINNNTLALEKLKDKLDDKGVI